MREMGFCGGRAAEQHVRLLETALQLRVVIRRRLQEDVERDARVLLLERLEELIHPPGRRAVHHGDALHVVAEEQGQPDVPLRLLSRAEDEHVGLGPREADEGDHNGQRRAEGGELFGVEEAEEFALGGEDVDASLYALVADGDDLDGGGGCDGAWHEEARVAVLGDNDFSGGLVDLLTCGGRVQLLEGLVQLVEEAEGIVPSEPVEELADLGSFEDQHGR